MAHEESGQKFGPHVLIILPCVYNYNVNTELCRPKQAGLLHQCFGGYISGKLLMLVFR